MDIMQIGNCMKGSNRDNPNQGRVYDHNGLAPTLSNMQGGGRQPMIIETKDLTSGGTESCLSRAEQSRAEQSRAAA